MQAGLRIRQCDGRIERDDHAPLHQSSTTCAMHGNAGFGGPVGKWHRECDCRHHDNSALGPPGSGGCSPRSQAAVSGIWAPHLLECGCWRVESDGNQIARRYGNGVPTSAAAWLPGLVVCLLALCSCGSSSRLSSASQVNPGTRSGSYMLTVSATSGSVTRNITLTLIVK